MDDRAIRRLRRAARTPARAGAAGAADARPLPAAAPDHHREPRARLLRDHAVVRGAHDLAALGDRARGASADALDGRVARLAGATSRFGLEYDSIADTVSFGVAPAMLAFAAGNLHVLGRPGWVMAFLFTACAALRLARFNVSPGRYKGRFEGMPSPGRGAAWSRPRSLVRLVPARGGLRDRRRARVAGRGSASSALGLLMVSPIPYRSGKELDLRHSFGTLVLVVIALAARDRRSRRSRSSRSASPTCSRARSSGCGAGARARRSRSCRAGARARARAPPRG